MKEYIAKVISLEDPEEWQRAQVRVYEKFPEDKIDDADLPWATYKLPVGAGFNQEAFVPAKVGDMVWVDFPFCHHDGVEDAQRPRVTGAIHWSPQGLSTMPHDAFGGPKGLDDLHHVPEVDKEIDPDYEEPKDSEPGRAAVFTKEGLTFRVQNGALTITHRQSGARWEISESGHLDFFSPRNLFLRGKNKLKIIGGELLLKATKLLTLDIPALEQKVKSWKLEAESVDITATGAAKILAKALQLSADGDMIVSGGGKRESSFSDSDLSKVGVPMIAEPGKAWGAELHVEGIPLAEVILRNDGGLSFFNSVANLLFDKDGNFQADNDKATASMDMDGAVQVSNVKGTLLMNRDGLLKVFNNRTDLKSDVLDAVLQTQLDTLDILNWFLGEYAAHFLRSYSA